MDQPPSICVLLKAIKDYIHLGNGWCIVVFYTNEDVLDRFEQEPLRVQRLLFSEREDRCNSDIQQKVNIAFGPWS